MSKVAQFLSLSRGLSRATLAVLLLTLVATGAASAQSIQVIHTFVGPDGARPTAGLTMDAGGKVYGTVRTGHSGSNWGGTFQMRQVNGGWIFNTLNIFDGQISSRAVFGPEGLIYGTSPNNIAGLPYGYLYSLSPGINACTSALCPWIETTIYGFTGGGDGGTPRYGDLIFDASGTMYGTTSLGGDSNGDGVVFSGTRSGRTWTEQPIYAFAGSPDGSHPYNGVILDNSGNLFGTTTAGGSSGNGTVFELSPNGNSWTETVLYNFTGGSDGGFPVSGLIQDSQGNLYGATASGGSGGGGTVFQLSPNGNSWTFNLLHSLSGAAQCGPWGSLNLDSQGNLWGTTLCDGANAYGNLFELTAGSWTYSSVYDFTDGNDGGESYARPIFDKSGNVYGTASIGGQNNAGTVWEITP